jgi:hypothetical protein
LIPRTIVVAAEPFPRLSATRVASAIARGVRAAAADYEVACDPREDPDTRFIDAPAAADADRLFDALPLGEVRALVLATPDLCDGRPPRGAIFELATRARQGGIPAYAVTGARNPDLFQARMLDLQVVLCARGEQSLRSAGRKLGALI